MPQLDKLSFATQYFWLTLFFFGLYFLTINFFIILVFKNLKLRSIIYKIWYFFIYKFDYKDYKNKNSSLLCSCYDSIYNVSFVNFLIVLKISSILEEVSRIASGNLVYLSSLSTYKALSLGNLFTDRLFHCLLIDNIVDTIELDEI